MTETSMDLFPSRLCYVQERAWAWFTTQPIEQAWGDDWNDAPYEHNAGPPYEWRPNSNDVPYALTIIGFMADLFDPAFFAPSVNVSISDINAKRMPWLRSGPWEGQQIEVWAGATITEFLDAVRAIGGKAFMEI